MKIVQIYENNDCCKVIFKLDDGYYIENSFKYPFWLCITTQVGCPVGCKFCKSGSRGFKRNLYKNEIMEQIRLSLIHAVGVFDFDLMFINTSFTGMGEPLLNIDNIIEIIKELQQNSDTEISIATTGITNSLEKLFFLPQKITLEVSLHSLDSKKRKELIPYEFKNPIDKTISYLNKHNMPANILEEKVHLKYILSEKKEKNILIFSIVNLVLGLLIFFSPYLNLYLEKRYSLDIFNISKIIIIVQLCPIITNLLFTFLYKILPINSYIFVSIN